MSSVVQIDLNAVMSEKGKEALDMTAQSLDTFANFGIGSAAFNITKKAADEAEQKTKAVIDAMIQLVENTIANLVESGVDKLYSAIGLNEETINAAKSIIKLADNATSLLSSGIMSGLLKLNSFNAMNLPMEAAVAGLKIIGSIADMFFAKYIEAYQVYIDLVTEFIIDPDAIIEVLKEAIDVIIKKIYDMIDEQVFLYTGFHIAQIRQYCAKGYNYYKQWKAAQKEMRERKQREEEEGVSTDSKSKTSTKVNVTINPEVMRLNMMNWLKAQGDALYNSFMLLQVMDAINSVKETIAGLTDVNLTTLADNINSLDDLIQLLDELGLGDDSLAVDLSIIPSLNINSMMSSLNSVQNTAMTIAADAALTSAAAVSSGMRIDVTASKSKTFDITTDFKTSTITLKIYADPTSKSLSKDLYKILVDSKTSDNKKIFNLAQAKLIQETINNLWKRSETSLKGSDIVYAGIYTIKIEIDASSDNGANKSVSKTYGNSAINPDKSNGKSEEKLDKNEEIIEDPLAGFKINLDVGIEEFYTARELEQKRFQTRRNTIQLLHTAYSLLKSIFPVLTQLAKLVQNYKINKLYAAQKSHDCIMSVFEEVMNKLGLNKKIQTNVPDDQGRLTAMYTVRTLALYEYITKDLHINITSDTTTYPINRVQVESINIWLRNNDSAAISVPTDKNIVLFIDFNSISEERACLDEQYNRLSKIMSSETMETFSKSCVKNQNGSFNGIENIEIEEDMILYSDKNLPRMPSQILMAQMRGCDPY